MTNNIKIYYNIFDGRNKTQTDYTQMINNPIFDNTMFIYTSNETNSGPGNSSHGGNGTAAISKNPKSFGIITNQLKIDSGFEANSFTINYETDIYKGKNINFKQDLKKERNIKQHIDFQVNYLKDYIDYYNRINNTNIDSIILPCAIKNGEIVIGTYIFKGRTDIDKIAKYIMDKLLKKFNVKKENLIDAKTLFNLISQPFNPPAKSSPLKNMSTPKLQQLKQQNMLQDILINKILLINV